ncbi:MAG: glycoside hydrolase family 32 protein [Bryobacteraceae bacterium]
MRHVDVRAMGMAAAVMALATQLAVGQTASLESLVTAGKFEDALREANLVLQDRALGAPGRAEARWWSAKALLGLRRQGQAVARLEEIVGDRESPSAVVRLAETELGALNVMFRFPEWRKRPGALDWVLFYPRDANYVGDPIPFVDGDKIHIFYMFSRPGIPGTSELHLATRDFLRYEDLGVAIPNRVEPGAIDRTIQTGSLIARDGTYHFFYGIANGEMHAKGKPGQVIRQAISKDLKSWTTVEDFVMVPDASKGYHPTESWRDPCVFWNEAEKQYWMLFTADSGDPSKHMWNRGVIGRAVSKDLNHWEIQEPFLSPGKYMNYECPNLFHWGNWYYLVYSPDMSPTRKETKYMMSKSLTGPWISPEDDVFDGRAFYAGAVVNKSEQEHYILGWISRKEGDNDSAHWKWGGQLMAHRMVQRADGTLGARMVDGVAAGLPVDVKVTPQRVSGDWTITGSEYTARAVSRPPNAWPAPLGGSGRSVLRLGTLPERCLFDFTITSTSHSGTAGILLGSDADFGGGFEVRLEGFRKRLRLTHAPDAFHINQELERPLAMTPGIPVHVTGLLDGNCLTVYVDGNIALSGRIYDRRANAFGVFVQDTEATFSGISIHTTE